MMLKVRSVSRRLIRAEGGEIKCQSVAGPRYLRRLADVLTEWKRQRLATRAPLAILSLLAVAASLSAAQQSIALLDQHPQTLDNSALLYIDKDKATISGNADARSVLTLLKDAKRFYSDRVGALAVSDPGFYCIIHLVHWSDPAKQGSSKYTQKVEAQNWYLFNGATTWGQDDFETNKRIFGVKHLTLLYIHLNRGSTAVPDIRYEISVASKEPANLVHLFQAASAFLPTLGEGANPPPPPVANYFGLADFNIAYSPSDISFAPFVVEDPKGLPKQTVVGDAIVFDNEGKYWWDVSVAVPIRKMGQLQFNSVNNTVTAQKPDKRSVFAVFDLYPFKKDVKSQTFDWHPYAVAGVAIGSQPLHKILAAAGWGPKYAQFYAGVLFARQASLTNLAEGSAATPAQLASATRMVFKPQFAFGINLPVREVFQAATSKTSKTSKSNSGSVAAGGAAPAAPTQ